MCAMHNMPISYLTLFFILYNKLIAEIPTNEKGLLRPEQKCSTFHVMPIVTLIHEGEH